MIDAGVTDVFVGESGEALGGGGGSESAGLDLGEEFEERGFVHGLLRGSFSGQECGSLREGRYLRIEISGTRRHGNRLRKKRTSAAKAAILTKQFRHG
jgi:hypothetical protein